LILPIFFFLFCHLLQSILLLLFFLSIPTTPLHPTYHHPSSNNQLANSIALVT